MLDKRAFVTKKAVEILSELKSPDGGSLIDGKLRNEIQDFRSSRADIVHDLLAEEAILKKQHRGGRVEIKDTPELSKKYKEAKDKELEKAIKIIDKVFLASIKVSKPTEYHELKKEGVHAVELTMLYNIQE